MVRIAHFGDTHIKNLKYHYEYRKAFEGIYKTLREQDVGIPKMCNPHHRRTPSISVSYCIR